MPFCLYRCTVVSLVGTENNCVGARRSDKLPWDRVTQALVGSSIIQIRLTCNSFLSQKKPYLPTCSSYLIQRKFSSLIEKLYFFGLNYAQRSIIYFVRLNIGLGILLLYLSVYCRLNTLILLNKATPSDYKETLKLINPNP